ncbi:MAG: 50S ribosomal protein L11 methyltransferase, partial [Pseudomonadota bacterium]
PMPETFTALTTLPGEAAAHALGEALEALDPMGVGVFEVEDGRGVWEVGGYFTERPDDVALALLAAAHGAAPFAVSRLPETDWVAAVRRELSPVAAGRFVVHGGHDREAVGWHRVGLEIEAAMAFGTGHHATTRGCLEALERLIQRGLCPRSVADIGAGTGVLAMAAARVWPVRALASDIDRVAAATARANARANAVAPRIASLCAPGFRQQRLRRAAPFDLVFANILAAPLKRLAPEMAAATAPGSRVILSGLLDRQAAGVLTVYAGHRFAAERRLSLDGWTTLTLRRY